MAVKRGLGKGLNGKGIDSLISPSATPRNRTSSGEKKSEKETPIQKKQAGTGKAKEKGTNVIKEAKNMAENVPDQYMSISDIEPNRQQPRRKFEEEALSELADSIKQYGMISPILVHKSGDYYEIIAGERRWRAAKLAGLKKVPVIIKEYTPEEVVEISLIENIQRENLNPIEEAMAYQRLITEFGLKQEELAARVSKSRAAVTNSLRLLRLDERVREMVIGQQISSGHARALLAVENKEQQYLLAKRAAEEALSVREIEKLVKKISKEQTNVRERSDKPDLSFIFRDLEDRITGVIGTKVNIHQSTGQKGKIEISYHSQEELERLTELLLSLSSVE